MKKIIIVVFLFFSIFSQSQQNNTLKVDYVKQNYESLYNKSLNQYIDGNLIHLFVDEYGNHIETGYPTKVSDKNIFVYHVISNKSTIDNHVFKQDINGTYNSQLNIQTNDLLTTSNSKTDEISEIVFSKIGPFTDKFDVKITKTSKLETSNNQSEIYNKTINIAKTYHVSLASGFFMTGLNNPSNIRTYEKPNGDITLIADDEGNRGFLTLNAVFYPNGRNYLNPLKGMDRVGYLVGTSLNKDQFENFFLGVQYDLFRGGSLATGVHYGRVNTIHDLEDFEFGEDIFEGDIDSVIKKDWDLGFFIGINLDIRIFGKIFNITE